jgi:succinyl-CoA synthetase alpha subunit
MSSRRPLASNPVKTSFQKRSLHLSTDQSSDLLKSYHINLATAPQSPLSSHYVGISPARSARSPSIIAAPTANPDQIHQRIRRFPFDYREGPTTAAVNAAIAHLQLDAAPPKAKAQTAELIKNLWNLYREKEAIDAHVSLALSETRDEIHVYDPYLFFDDAAFKSNKRQSDLHSLRDESQISETDREADQAGIVYIPLASPVFQNGTKQKDTQTAPSSSAEEPRNLVGTLVNGAGLAMNTNDVLHIRLSEPPYNTTSANFLDTGGKATSATIKTSFKLILSDPRVSVVFVNIFGGLTLCDMIAEGIIMAFKEIGVEKPVVVRLRGTNEELGQKVLQEANLPIHAFDDFEEAVKKVGELANGGR